MFKVDLANNDCIFNSAKFETIKEAKEWIEAQGAGFRAMITGEGIDPNSKLANFCVTESGYKCFDGWEWYTCNPFDEIERDDETEKEYYYWLDTTETWNSPRKGEAILIRGQYNEDGEKDRDTEEEILEFTAADCGIIPDDNEAGEKIDAYITAQLGFLPDYEVN